jgi:hypothetical protein
MADDRDSLGGGVGSKKSWPAGQGDKGGVQAKSTRVHPTVITPFFLFLSLSTFKAHRTHTYSLSLSHTYRLLRQPRNQENKALGA